MVPPLRFRQVLALNAPEWRHITVGSISATINGFSMPAFIVIFGNLFGVSNIYDSVCVNGFCFMVFNVS